MDFGAVVVVVDTGVVGHAVGVAEALVDEVGVGVAVGLGHGEQVVGSVDGLDVTLDRASGERVGAAEVGPAVIMGFADLIAEAAFLGAPPAEVVAVVVGWGAVEQVVVVGGAVVGGALVGGALVGELALEELVAVVEALVWLVGGTEVRLALADGEAVATTLAGGFGYTIGTRWTTRSGWLCW